MSNQTIKGPDGFDIAVIAEGERPDDGRKGPGVIWLSGLLSDMIATKAAAIAAHGAEKGFPVLRFDYRGHGASGGDFKDASISELLSDALAVFDRFAKGAQILIGSSMGGWIALLLALALKERKKAGEDLSAHVAGIVLIAPAVDMTRRLMGDAFTTEIRAEIEEKGVYYRPSDYGDPYPITKKLIEDGEKHLLLGDIIPLSCPVHIIHGREDPDVPWELSQELTAWLSEADVDMTFIRDGDHRLSRPEDIAVLLAAVDRMRARASGGVCG